MLRKWVVYAVMIWKFRLLTPLSYITEFLEFNQTVNYVV